MTGYQKDRGEEEYPDTRITSSNLKAALVGYNPIVGDTLRDDGPDPGMKMQIFAAGSFRKVFKSYKLFAFRMDVEASFPSFSSSS